MTTITRIPRSASAPAISRAISALDASADFEPRLRELMRNRASQLNGTYCVDMHSVDEQRGGEGDRRIFALATWRENPFFDERERATLALTDALARLGEGGVPDDVYEAAADVFSEGKLARLIGIIIAISAWSRVGVGTGMRLEALT